MVLIEQLSRLQLPIVYADPMVLASPSLTLPLLHVELIGGAYTRQPNGSILRSLDYRVTLYHHTPHNAHEELATIRNYCDKIATVIYDLANHGYGRIDNIGFDIAVRQGGEMLHAYSFSFTVMEYVCTIA